MQIDSSQNYPSSSLYRFFEPVKLAMESYVQDCGHSASQLEPIIKCSIEEAIKSSSNIPGTPVPRILRQNIESNSKIYIDAVLSQTNDWQFCREQIKAYSSIFLIGAGLSYSSDMPLANILNDLLSFCGVNNWDELRRDASKFLKFKRQFKTLCDRKSPSTGHKLIVTNFPRYIYEIICLNWDDLFEKAANELAVSIKKQNVDEPVTSERYLWKFHGDVENIKGDNVKGQGGWVLPDEDGFVFNSFHKYVRTSLKEEMFSFIILGYNENEEVIYKQIISILAEAPPRPTYRIGLDLKNLHKDNYIVGTAEFILNKVLPISRITSS